MLSIVASLLPILLALAGGWLLAIFISPNLRQRLVKLITPFIWLLLFSIGYEFGNVLGALSSARESALTALVFALLTTAVPWLILSWGAKADLANQASSKRGLAGILQPLKECVIALLTLALGVGVYYLWGAADGSGFSWPSTSYFLYVLIVLVGLDLYGVRPDPSWYSLRTLKIPAVVVIGSLLGGLLAAWWTGQPLAISLALASGFGWFTLSGVLVGHHAGEAFGAMALLTDLFREILAIGLLYSLGARRPLQCIAAGGATSLDSTLPIVKQTCPPELVPVALVSGFLLTVAGPLLMVFFLSV